MRANSAAASSPRRSSATSTASTAGAPTSAARRRWSRRPARWRATKASRRRASTPTRSIHNRPEVPKETCMSDTSSVCPSEVRWERVETSRIPFAAYTSDEVHKRELERFFYKGHWCYVGLEAEIPNPGDFKRTVVGERSVILVRALDGTIHVVENVCAHRGMAFCRLRNGNRKDFTCPYH